MSLILDEHRELLSDPFRLRAFEAALAETIDRDDQVVLDLGSGSGILGLLACRAGARHVYSVDDGGVIQVAREIARANGLADRVTCIKGLSTRITLPERVDVVVADQIGHFGFEAGLLEYFADASARFLKPGGVTIPACVELHLAPVELPGMWDRVEFWRSAVAGFDMTAAFPIAINTGYPVKLTRDQLLGPAATLVSLDPSSSKDERVAAAVTLIVERPGTLHGLGGWFSARLSRNVWMTNEPGSPAAIARRNVYFPISRPLTVSSGDRACVTMSIVPSDLIVTWTIVVTGPDGATKARFQHSTWRGMLLCPEDLVKSRSDYAPRLSPWGEARRSVLELCDGRTVTQIENELRIRHPQLFLSQADAARFVGEVLIPYGV